jgi:hypothetical protein
MSKWVMASPFVAVGVVALVGYGLLTALAYQLEKHAP